MLRGAVIATLVAGCTYAYKTHAGEGTPASVLVQRRRLNEPVENAQVRTEAIIVASSGPAAAQPLESAEPAGTAKLVIEVWLRMQTDDVGATAAAVRARVIADGGRIVSENLVGSGRDATSAALELRVPPARQAAVVDWIAGRGRIQSRRTLGTDVSKTLFDQELELTNLRLTMTRLQELARRDVPIKELLEIEKELTRVRGDIERLEGEKRWLEDRVEYASITLLLEREGQEERVASSARFRVGPRLSTLWVIDGDSTRSARLGGGVAVHVWRQLTVELDVFPRRDGESRAVIATAGAAFYSSYLGGGRRRWLNPYVGARAGYGFLADRGATVVAGEVGLELYRHRYLLVDGAVRALAFVRKEDTLAAMHAVVGVAIPF